MESDSPATIIYRPVESVTVPVPAVLITLTEGSGIDRDISYTRPLTLTWAIQLPVTASNPINMIIQPDRKSV